MPFIDTSALEVIERLPGWYGHSFVHIGDKFDDVPQLCCLNSPLQSMLN